jgi:hypothetical protein
VKVTPPENHHSAALLDNNDMKVVLLFLIGQTPERYNTVKSTLSLWLLLSEISFFDLSAVVWSIETSTTNPISRKNEISSLESRGSREYKG